MFWRRILLALAVSALAALSGVVASSPRSAHADGVILTAVSAGGSHTCALTDESGVKCWGDNTAGQLGDGTQTLRTTPVNVIGLGSGVAAVSAGGQLLPHTCALTDAGGAKCWGYNGFGQLGVDPLTNLCPEPVFGGEFPCSTVPVDVPGLESGVAAITTGSDHTCVLTTAGGVKCWGRNSLGRLGNGSSELMPQPTPQDVVGLESGVFAIAAGGNHTCAITTGGGLKCWGMATFGQLGVGPNLNQLELCPDPFTVGVFQPCSTTPVDVGGLGSGVAAVATGGAHTCAITTSGGAQCWGGNPLGQLGFETTERCAEPSSPTGFSQPCSTVPMDVTGLTSGVASITASSLHHTCAVVDTGSAKCWGNNFRGSLGDGAETNRTTPVDVCQVYDAAAEQCVLALSGVAAVDAGDFFTCALTTEGGLLCWGSNCCGQFGNGTMDFDPHPTPVAIPGFGPKPTPTPTGTVTPTITASPTEAPAASPTLISTPPPASPTATSPATPPTPTDVAIAPGLLLPSTGKAVGSNGGASSLWVSVALVATGLALAGCGLIRLKRKACPEQGRREEAP